MLCTGPKHLETLLFRSPLQNVDIDMPNAPPAHLQPCWLVKVDRVRADQCQPVVVNDVFFVSPDDPEMCSQRIARPIRCRAHDVLFGKPLANGIFPATALRVRVSSRSNLRHVTKV